MADGLCGPSNALQNFQKHSTVDRTLQQDRLIARQSPQGFRSSPGPNAGFLDPEFEAFQAGQSPLQQLESQNFQQHHGFSYVPQNLGQAGPSAWANDFHRLSISSPPPQFQQSPVGHQSQQRLDTGGWHQDFASQQNQVPEQAMPQFHGQNASTYRFSPMSAMNTHPMFAGSFANTQAEQSSIPQQLQQPEAFDEEAFARAFEEASKTEADVTQDLTQRQDTELRQDIMINETAELLMESEPVLDHRLGADLIHDPARENQELQEQNDPDALARTAAQLLDSVSNNQTDKFQNSQFLELMRQFRDREVMVEGDKIVGTMADSQSQIKNEILTLSRTLKKWALDRDRPLRGSDGTRQRGIIESLLGLIPLYSKLLQTTDGSLIIQESRIQRTLAGMAENPAVHELPDIHSQVLISLSLFNHLAQAPTSTQEHETIQQRALQQDSQLRRIQESWERQAMVQRPEAEIETAE